MEGRICLADCTAGHERTSCWSVSRRKVWKRKCFLAGPQPLNREYLSETECVLRFFTFVSVNECVRQTHTACTSYMQLCATSRRAVDAPMVRLCAPSLTRKEAFCVSQGSYFADDAGKIDQYVREGVAYNGSIPLHQVLRRSRLRPCFLKVYQSRKCYANACISILLINRITKGKSSL